MHSSEILATMTGRLTITDALISHSMEGQTAWSIHLVDTSAGQPA